MERAHGAEVADSAARGRGLWRQVWWHDALLAVGIAMLEPLLALTEAGTLGEQGWRGVDAWGVLLLLLGTLPLAVRRRWPGPVLAVVSVALLVASLTAVPASGLALLVAVYSYAAWTTRDDTRIALSVIGFASLISLGAVGAVRSAPVSLVVLFIAWVLGGRQRVQRLRAGALERRAEALERERGRTAELAGARERTRIAQELHDVVAHGVSAMVAQTIAAERLVVVHPHRAVTALEEAERAGRASLAELRRLLRLLRVDQPTAEATDRATTRATAGATAGATAVGSRSPGLASQVPAAGGHAPRGVRPKAETAVGFAPPGRAPQAHAQSDSASPRRQFLSVAACTVGERVHLDARRGRARRRGEMARHHLSGRAADVAIVAALVAVDLSLLWLAPVDPLGDRGSWFLGLLVLLTAPLPLLWRRRAPVAVFVATVILGSLTLLTPLASQVLAPLVALFTVAACCTRRVAVTCLAIALTLATVFVVAIESVPVVPQQWLVIGTAWLLGDVARARGAHTRALADRTHALVLDRARASELAVVEERTRIARELHDIVAHSLGVMVVQAGAARRVLPVDPERAGATAHQVGELGRETLGELRRLLGLLREEGAGAALKPQPGLGDIEDLIAELAGTPLQIRLLIEGDVRPLPAGLDLSAYRIVQESLTNALRHAGPAHVEVRLRWHADHVLIEIADDGLGPLVPVVTAGDAGHGVRGMHERAALVGGSLHIGPRPGGGFLVTATLPLETL